MMVTSCGKEHDPQTAEVVVRPRWTRRIPNRCGSSEIELAAGLGLRLDLPIGAVHLEYGYNLTQNPGQPAGTFHFATSAAS